MVMTCHENTHPCFLSENKKPAKSDVWGYTQLLLIFINSIMRSKKYYIDIFWGYTACTMKKVNVNKIFVLWICVDANISAKFI